MKKVFYIGLLATAVIACKPEEKTPSPVNNEVSNFQDMKVDAGFNYSAVKTVTLNLEKVTGANNRSGMLTVKDMSGNVLTKLMVRRDQASSIDFTIPTDAKKVKVQFGLADKEVVINGNQASFDFIPVIDNSDLD